MSRRHSRYAKLLSLRPLLQLGRSGVHLITLGLVALSLWALATFVGQVMMSAQMDRHRQELQSEIAQIEAENAALKQQVEYAESPVHAEQIAREQLGYARDGDTVILPTFPDDLPAPASATALAPIAAQPHQPNWRGWLHAFFPPADSA